jgi:hypothetical protein
MAAKSLVCIAAIGLLLPGIAHAQFPDQTAFAPVLDSGLRRSDVVRAAIACAGSDVVLKNPGSLEPLFTTKLVGNNDAGDLIRAGDAWQLQFMDGHYYVRKTQVAPQWAMPPAGTEQALANKIAACINRESREVDSVIK